MRGHLSEMPIASHPIPYYYQIAGVLRRRIEAGEMAPGERLPKEMDLAEMFGVSRVPVRQALSLLAAEGVLTHKRGRGTFVREGIAKTESFRLTGLIGGKISKGKEHRMIAVEDVAPTPQLAEFFGLRPDEGLTRFRRLRLEQNTPYCYIVNYLGREIARGIKGAKFENKTMLEIIQGRLAISLGKILQTFEARIADNEIANRLSIAMMAPVFYVETFVRDKMERPLEFSQIYYPGDRHKYSVEILADSDVG